MKLILHHALKDLRAQRWLVAFWVTITAAMMLPSAVPLLRLFVETSAGQVRRGRLLACFAAGYLAVWLVFGWAALVFDGGVHQAVDALPWLAARPAPKPRRRGASSAGGARPSACRGPPA